MMDEYIKREEAITALNELCEQVCPYSKLQRGAMCGSCTLGSAFDGLEDDIPAADVVEVVRCKNCKHSHLMFNKALICWNCNSNVKFPISADDFCCHGERRTDNETK